LTKFNEESTKLERVEKERQEFQTDYIPVLRIGEVFVQYENRGNPQHRRLQITNDFKSFEIRDIEENVVKKTIDIGKIVELVENAKSPTFQRFAAKLEGNINTCFSILLEKAESYDFKAERPDLRNTWVVGIQGVLDFFGTNNRVSIQRKKVRDIESEIHKNIDAQRKSYNFKNYNNISNNKIHENQNETYITLNDNSSNSSRPNRGPENNSHDVKGLMAENKEKLGMRGEALLRVDEATEQLALASDDFLAKCKQLSRELKN